MLASSAEAERASVSSVMKFCATHDARCEATQSLRRSVSTPATKVRASATVGAAGAETAARGGGGGEGAEPGAGATFGSGGGGSTSHAARAVRAASVKGRSAGGVRFTRRLLHGGRGRRYWERLSPARAPA